MLAWVRKYSPATWVAVDDWPLHEDGEPLGPQCARPSSGDGAFPHLPWPKPACRADRKRRHPCAQATNSPGTLCRPRLDSASNKIRLIRSRRSCGSSGRRWVSRPNVLVVGSRPRWRRRSQMVCNDTCVSRRLWQSLRRQVVSEACVTAISACSVVARKVAWIAVQFVGGLIWCSVRAKRRHYKRTEDHAECAVAAAPRRPWPGRHDVRERARRAQRRCSVERARRSPRAAAHSRTCCTLTRDRFRHWGYLRT
eukprot:1141047-Prymnesium_polylepis.1